MAAEKDLAYSPDYAVPPGETLLETIEALGMTQAELAAGTGRPPETINEIGQGGRAQADLAARTGRTLKTINEIVKGKAPIRPDTALQLERALGVPASFWNNRERNYREVLARRGGRERVEGPGKGRRGVAVPPPGPLGWGRGH